MPLLRTAAVVVLCLLVTSCSGDDQPSADPSSARPTPITRLDSASMKVVRVAFCDLVPKAAVRRALAAAPTGSTSWRNGDPLKDAGGEVGHEFGCAWRGSRGQAARAWVFARPVSPAFARTLVRLAATERGCRSGAGPGFGDPALVQDCVRPGGTRRVRHAGLFGDTWLSCEVSGRSAKPALLRRADAWCVSVASALDAG